MTTETTEHRTRFLANPVQKQFIMSRADADLFSSRMGEGKSAGLCWAIWYYTRHNPGAICALVRDTWENLKATTLKEFFEWFPPGVFGTWKAQDKTYTWRAEGMQGEVQCLGLDDPDDAAKLQSRFYGLICFDEPAPAADTGGIAEIIFDVALSRTRQKGMHWYAVKLATNNPDETHWSYLRFVDPGTEGFRVFQPIEPENVRNLPQNYYEKLEKKWAGRPDLIRRFIRGQYGFQQIGKTLTPEWEDRLHLAYDLKPVPGRPLELLWDFGTNPTCLITQVTTLRYWFILEAFVGEDIGALELIEDVVKPTLVQRYEGYTWRHIGDPNGTKPDQSSSQTSAVRVIRRELGGVWINGPTSIHERVEPIRAVLRKTISGLGMVQVDRVRAKAVWHALRGGWHRPVSRTGVTGQLPVKNIHSHPGDALGYGAAKLFPLGRVLDKRKPRKPPQQARFFGSPRARVPAEARVIGDARAKR